MSANISRIVYHVDMNSHPVSIRGMKTVLIHCSGRPGEWPGAPPLSYLRVWMNAPPPPFSLYLKVFIRHCSAPRLTRPSLAPLQNLRRNHCVKRSLMKPYPICFSCQCKSYPVLSIDVVVQFYPWFNLVW